MAAEVAADRFVSSVSYTDGTAIGRDEWAARLRADLEAGDPAVGRIGLLTHPEGVVIAQLLDELAAAYPGDDVGRLAREMAVRLWDRMGI